MVSFEATKKPLPGEAKREATFIPESCPVQISSHWHENYVLSLQVDHVSIATYFVLSLMSLYRPIPDYDYNPPLCGSI